MRYTIFVLMMYTRCIWIFQEIGIYVYIHMYMKSVTIVYSIVYIHPIYTLSVYILYTYRHPRLTFGTYGLWWRSLILKFDLNNSHLLISKAIGGGIRAGNVKDIYESHIMIYLQFAVWSVVCYALDRRVCSIGLSRLPAYLFVCLSVYLFSWMPDWLS